MTPDQKMTVWKFPINAEDDSQVLKLPRGFTILHAGADPALPETDPARMAIWVMIPKPADDGWMADPERHMDVPISVYGTGQQLPEAPVGLNGPHLTHISTVNLGPFMWHVFRDHTREKGFWDA